MSQDKDTTFQKLAKVYVSLDSLMDTRAAVLTVLNTEFAYKVTSSDLYHLRDEDVFGCADMGTLNKELYQKIERTRRRDLLPNAMRTRMFEFLEQLMTKLFLDALHTPYHSSVAIDVNYYPFELNEDEQLLMVASIGESLKGLYTVNLINKSPAELDIDYVRENYRAMIMYQYHDWMNHWDKEIKTKPLKDLTIFTPRLHHIRAITEEEIKEAGFEKFNLDPFTLLQLLLKTTVLIQHLPIALFCADTPANLAEYSRWGE